MFESRKRDTMAYATDLRANGQSIAQRIAAFRADLTEKLAKRAVYRTTLTELSQLTSRELADLGIHRSAIKGIAYEAAYGKE
jgi:uncharacterized protein YjiS (DUF1127 family)